MRQNQHGLTLIEVLATLTILSIAGIIVWNVFFQGYNYSQSAISKNTMQQEANIIITSLKKIHQTSKEYTITNIDDSGCSSFKITYIHDNSETVQEQLFQHPRLCISTNFTGNVNTVDNNSIPLAILVKDRSNPNNHIEIETLLFRIKESNLDVSN